MNWKREIKGDDLKLQAEADQTAIAQAMKEIRSDSGVTRKILDTGGKGEAIIFLPMVSELNFVYAPQIVEFQKEFRVVLFEPHLSRTSYFGIADRAKEVLEIMKLLGLKKAHVVAWSDTGSPAYYLAKHYPDACLSVVFLGLADRYVFPQPVRFLVKLLEKTPIEHITPGKLLARILSWYLGGEQVKPKWVAEKAAKISQLPRLFKHSVLPNLTEHLPKRGEITVPSINICGDKDALVTTQQANNMAALLSESGSAVIIPGGEHFLCYANSELVNQAVWNFFRSLTSNRSANEF